MTYAKLPHKRIRTKILDSLKLGLTWKITAANANMSVSKLQAIRNKSREMFAAGDASTWSEFHLELQQAKATIPQVKNDIYLSALNAVKVAIEDGDEVTAMKYISETNRTKQRVNKHEVKSKSEITIKVNRQ